METAGLRAKRHRRPSETLIEYATALDVARGGDEWRLVAEQVAASAYGSSIRGREEQEKIVKVAERLRKTTPAEPRTLLRSYKR